MATRSRGGSFKVNSTKKARNYCRKKFTSQLTIEPEEYLQLKQAFQSGATHAVHD